MIALNFVAFPQLLMHVDPSQTPRANEKGINGCEKPCRSPIEPMRDYCGWETKQVDLVMKKQFPPKPPGTTSLFQPPHWRQLECRRISTAPAPANIMQDPLSLQGFLEQNCHAFCSVHCSIIASPGWIIVPKRFVGHCSSDLCKRLATINFRPTELFFCFRHG